MRDPKPAAARGRFSRRAMCAAAIATCALFTGLAGCVLLNLHRENVEYSAATVLAGRVLAGDAWRGPVSVAAIREARGKKVIEHEVWLHEPGAFALVVPDGEYTLVAYADADNDGRPDSDAPAGRHAAAVKVAGAGLITMVDIPLRRGAAAEAQAALPAHHRRAARPSSAPGALARLDRPQFGVAAGKRGYWAPMEYFREYGGNVFFVEPYDPAKTPVLFVHGALGSAQDWRYFVEHLDRSRHQPWIFQYPSGAPLSAMANLLYWNLLNLQIRYNFARLEVVAHSMGGLVARRFLMDQATQFPQISQFVSISTPWGGQHSAGLGVIHSPAVIPSWRDMDPAGSYLAALFEKPLPASITHTLIFGHRGGQGLMHERDASDGTISVASQLRPEAQQGAALVLGFDADHAGILSSPEVVSEVERVLEAAEGRARAAGSVAVRLESAGSLPGGLSTMVLRRVDGAVADDLLLAIAGRADSRLGPLPPGEYEARLAAEGFRALPDRQHLRIEAGGTAQVVFQLRPDGVILGDVVARSDRVKRPAGSYQREDNALRADSITLTGPGVSRELLPHMAARGSLLTAYLEGRDEASNQGFCFVGLPAGQYQLTVKARGFETYTTSHTVVPGRFTPLGPVVMRRLR